MENIFLQLLLAKTQKLSQIDSINSQLTDFFGITKKINFDEPIKVEFKQFGQDVLNNIIRMNQNQRTWKLQDFLDM